LGSKTACGHAREHTAAGIARADGHVRAELDVQSDGVENKSAATDSGHGYGFRAGKRRVDDFLVAVVGIGIGHSVIAGTGQRKRETIDGQGGEGAGFRTKHGVYRLKGFDKGSQGAVESGLSGNGNDTCGLYVSERDFQIPVSAEGLVTGHIVGGRDVGIGQFRDQTDERASVSVLGDIATIKKYIGSIRQCGVPTHEVGRVAFKIQAVQDRGTQHDGACGAMRENVQVRYAGIVGQDCRDLLNTVRTAVEIIDVR